MAARVTKQFLENALQDASAKAKTKGKQPPKKQQQAAKKQRATPKKVRAAASSSAKKPKKSERFLDVAKQELESADRTRENVQKLQVRATDKSQRLMAKVLALRQKAFR